MKRHNQILIKAISAVAAFSLLPGQLVAYQTVTNAERTYTFTGTSREKGAYIYLPAGAVAYDVKTDNGSVSYSQSGTTITAFLTGGSGTTQSSQVWNAKKYSKYVTVSTGAQSSDSFPSTYSYNDGSYSGTLTSGSATLVSGSEGGSKTATYDYYYTGDATATITSIQNGTLYFSWSMPSVDSTYYYRDSDGYDGPLSNTGNTYVDSCFYFPSPNYVGQTGSGTVSYVFHYSGYVTKSDTRQWTMDYSGTVYMGGYDTVTTTNYTYNVTVYYKITTNISDTTPPTGSATLSPSGMTTGNVVITMTAQDSGSGVQSITLPDGTVVNAASTDYAVSENGVYTFLIKDADGNTASVPVTVANIVKTISITHPVSISFVLDPNNDQPFSCPDIPLFNQSGVKVSVSVSDFSESTESSIVQPTDVLPEEYPDWDSLNAEQTKSALALGIRIRETESSPGSWFSVDQRESIYAAEISSETRLGVLHAGGTGHLSLTAYAGRAWGNQYVLQRKLTLLFECAE